MFILSSDVQSSFNLLVFFTTKFWINCVMTTSYFFNDQNCNFSKVNENIPLFFCCLFQSAF